MKRWALFLVVLLQSCGGTPQAITDFELLTPRPFGYLIGDEIVHRVLIHTRNGVTLNKSQLPAQGIRNRWLNINQVHVSESQRGSEHHYQINLRYQVFYAPQTVKMLNIPSFTLTFQQGQQQVEQTVPAWQFTLSPLRELSVRKDEHGEYLRPSLPPPVIAAPHNALLLLSGVALLSSALGLAYCYGFIRLPRRRIFKRASQQLGQTDDLAQGLQILHHALNTLNGKPLFTHQLTAFYTLYPPYQAADTLLTDFFQHSTAYFFAQSITNETQVWQNLKRCCAVCADIERGLN